MRITGTGSTPRAKDLWRPSGWNREYGCHDCHAIVARYTYGRCDRCALAAVFDHLTPNENARRTLAPLREAFLNGPRPVTCLRWLRKNPELLIGMGTGTIAIDHAALDALPRSRTTEFIRGQLVATSCLPQRNTYAADFQNWLSTYLTKLEPGAHRLLLQEYGTWRLLPRIHRPRDPRPQTYSTLQNAKTRIRTAHRFLTWLDERTTPLPEATQADVEEFLTHHRQLTSTLEPFLRWKTRARKSPRLACHPQRKDQPKPAITADERWDLLRRLLHDENLDLADRLIGAIILTYAIPLTKTLMLRTEDIRIADDGDAGRQVYLRLGPTEVRLPPVLDQLTIEQLHHRHQRRAGTGIASGPWLFPGTRAGQPLSHARALVRLRRLGLHPGPGRSRAQLHLAARIEAPLLAQAL